MYGHYLAHASNGHNEMIRYFGLGLLENVIRFKWHTSYSAEDKSRIVDALVDLVQHGLLPYRSEKKYIREKTARIFAELMEREWPQRWPGLETLLESLFTSSVRFTGVSGKFHVSFTLVV
jgi:hypothetical protein